MDRCALFVDAGYALGDGAMAVHGTRNRDSVTWDYASLVQVLGNVARDRTGLPLLRCYWYEATVEGRRTAEHEKLADLPGVKLRLGRMRPGHREGVESEIHRDLTTLARNRAISDALILSAEEDLTQVVSEVQDLGLRVILMQVALSGTAPSVAASLRQECDDLVEISAAHLRPSVELVVGAEPAAEQERQPVGAYASRAPSNGHGPSGPLAPRALPTGSHAAAPAIYTGPVIAEYQRAAQPGLGQPGPSVNSSGLISGPAGPTVTGQGPSAPGARPVPQPPQAPVAQPPTPPSTRGPAQGLVGQPGMPGPSSAPAQQAPGGQPGASPQLGAQPGLPGQPGMPGAQLGSVAMQPGQAAPGLPQRGAGHHAAPPSAPEAPPPPGPVHHGHHELAPQAAPPGQPVTPPGMVQPGMAQPGMPTYQPAPPPAAGFRGQGSDPLAGQAGGSRMPPGNQDQALAGPGAPGRQATPSAPVQPVQPVQPGQAPGLPGSYQAGAQARPPAGPVDQRPAQQYPAQLPGQADGGGYIPQQGSHSAGSHSAGSHSVGSPSAGPHSGPQPAAQAPVPQPVAVSLADAVQAAHGEGFNFGQTVARDAPALWLEAVLARKPRMPSDLEARLLQDSSLPIDSLLHDEVRHALRRGFWDALERVRH